MGQLLTLTLFLSAGALRMPLIQILVDSTDKLLRSWQYLPTGPTKGTTFFIRAPSVPHSHTANPLNDIRRKYLGLCLRISKG